MASTGEKLIALDTNILLSIEQFKVDALEEMKALAGKAVFVIPGQVWKELQGLKQEGKTLARRVKVAEEVVRKGKVKKVEVEAENADQALVRLAEKGAIVATNDRELKKEVKKVNGSIMFLRQKRFIVKE